MNDSEKDTIDLIRSLNDGEKQQIGELMEREAAATQLQNTIHSYTSMCWDKCVTGTPGNAFSRSEADCLQNCVDRFFDAKSHIIKTIVDGIQKSDT